MLLVLSKESLIFSTWNFSQIFCQFLLGYCVARLKGNVLDVLFYCKSILIWKREHPMSIFFIICGSCKYWHPTLEKTIYWAVTGSTKFYITLPLNLQACYGLFGNVVGSYKDFWTSNSFSIISKFRRWSWHSGWAEVLSAHWLQNLGPASLPPSCIIQLIQAQVINKHPQLLNELI